MTARAAIAKDERRDKQAKANAAFAAALEASRPDMYGEDGQ